MGGGGKKYVPEYLKKHKKLSHTVVLPAVYKADMLQHNSSVKAQNDTFCIINGVTENWKQMLSLKEKKKMT